MIATSRLNRSSSPYLCFYSVLGGAEKRFDMQVLFDPFEEQLHLPTTTAEFGNG